MTERGAMDSDFPTIISGEGDLAAYFAREKAALDAQLATSGAILFRGFEVPDPQAFDAVVGGYGEEDFAYADSLSNAVRVNVTDRVFTANEAPPTTSIYLHHEMAQTPIYPSKLFFYCEIAPDEGGATPLCRSDILLEQMEAADPEFVAAFAEKRVRYTNVMPADDDTGSGQGRSWRSTLSADTPDAAEARLQSLGYEWEWQDDETLRVTTPPLDAVRSLPDGSRSFFNQLIAAFRGWSDSRNDPSKSICFGDGTPIDGDQMAGAIALADALSYDLEWQAGDVALVDNFRVMHGRRPFVGKRRVLASLIK
ncbi:SyrP protein [Parasphingopyxis sp. CP4]|uniref:TauD/TfdA family dioxygenase n=1 Tax=Parasphingopyxis sp. CP4 TaxID=2724527 RepID=UPI0015A3976D|nr:TauD/TfdA family dioxygenase [Parasphingopyxis sp. CP4]QLC22008.1 SyrP protein [Parasphingopyxis sp. CP4]